MAKTKWKLTKYELGVGGVIGAIALYLLILTGYSMALVWAVSRIIFF